MCVYGMEGPGGYQFVGRTVQMWNKYRQTHDFKDGKPWLLRFFDQIRFYEVSHEELMQMREDFPRGKVRLKVEETTFNLKAYKAFLNENSESIDSFVKTQRSAFEEERLMWERTGLANFSAEHEAEVAHTDEMVELGDNEGVEAPVQGNLWKVNAKVGDEVKEGDVLAIAESMKMEIAIEASESGKIIAVLCAEGENIHAGKLLFIIEPVHS